MLQNSLTSEVKRLIESSTIPEEMKETYLGILAYLPASRVQKMISLLRKEQLILQK